ncbi:MAG: cytidylate kinase-like family protein [Gammaproteobacteria bacterium]|nr:cytidylate kinase-like family protein [Gammaproteobacteria bacterium]
MSTSNEVEHFLAGMAKPGGGRAVRLTNLPFVTISRQAGIDAQAYANALLQAISTQTDKDLSDGWQIFDRALCQQIVDDDKLSRSTDDLLTKEYRSQIEEFIGSFFSHRVPQDEQVKRVAKVMLSLAGIGKVILIGSGGSQAARDLSHGIHVRLIAPQNDRLHWLMDEHSLKESDANRLLKDMDRSRKQLLHDHFQTEIDNPENYHCVFNVSRINPEQFAHLVLPLI